jgi:hypothetical protein
MDKILKIPSIDTGYRDSPSIEPPCRRDFTEYARCELKQLIPSSSSSSSSLSSLVTALFFLVLLLNGARGGVVIKALRYKPAGRGFDSR